MTGPNQKPGRPTLPLPQHHHPPASPQTIDSGYWTQHVLHPLSDSRIPASVAPVRAEPFVNRAGARWRPGGGLSLMKRPVPGPMNRSLTHIHIVPLINWLTIVSATARGVAEAEGGGGTNTALCLCSTVVSDSYRAGRTEFRPTIGRLQSKNKLRQNWHKAKSFLQMISVFVIKSKFGKRLEFLYTSGICTQPESWLREWQLLLTFR